MRHAGDREAHQYHITRYRKPNFLADSNLGMEGDTYGTHLLASVKTKIGCANLPRLVPASNCQRSVRELFRPGLSLTYDMFIFSRQGTGRRDSSKLVWKIRGHCYLPTVVMYSA